MFTLLFFGKELCWSNELDVAGSINKDFELAPTSQIKPMRSCGESFVENKCEAYISEQMKNGNQRTDYLDCSQSSTAVSAGRACGGAFFVSSVSGALFTAFPGLTTAAFGAVLISKGLEADAECSKNMDAKRIIARPYIAYLGEDDPSIKALLEKGCAFLANEVQSRVRNLRGRLIEKKAKVDQYVRAVNARETRGLSPTTLAVEQLTPNEIRFLDELEKIQKDQVKLQSAISSVRQQYKCASSEKIVAAVCSIVGGGVGFGSMRKSINPTASLPAVSREANAIGRNLTPAQLKALETVRRPTDAGISIDGFTAQQRRMLKDAGFSEDEMRKLMESGIVGARSTPSAIARAQLQITESQIKTLPLVEKNQEMVALGFFRTSADDAAIATMDAKRIAMGLPKLTGVEVTPALNRFRNETQSRLSRKISIYPEFKGDGVGPVMGGIKAKIDKTIELAPGRRSVAVDLTGFDPIHLKSSRYGFTNAEIALLYSNPRYFNATIWYRNGREIPSQEVYKMLAPYKGDLVQIMEMNY